MWTKESRNLRCMYLIADLFKHKNRKVACLKYFKDFVSLLGFFLVLYVFLRRHVNSQGKPMGN